MSRPDIRWGRGLETDAGDALGSERLGYHSLLHRLALDNGYKEDTRWNPGCERIPSHRH